MVLSRLRFAAFTLLVSAMACGPAPEPVTPVSKETSMALYVQKCALCHGQDGKLGASRAPDLTQSRMGLAERERIIQYGKGLMPPQGAVLSPEEIAGIALYLNTFSPIHD